MKIWPSSPGAMRMALLALVVLLGFGAIAAAIGYWGGERQVIAKVNERIVQPALARFKAPATEETIAWETANTHFFPLQIARVPLSQESGPALMSITEIGGNILYVTRLGVFGYLDTENRIQRLEGLQVQMGLDELAQSPLFRDPAFQLSEFRVIDLISRSAGDAAHDLYVSHHRYRNGCFELVVSRARLISDAEGLRTTSPDWEEIYAMEPCLQPKDLGMRFAGHEGGGRIQLLNEDTLLLSVGVYQFDGMHAPIQAGQDDANALGKIIEISIRTGQNRVFARGLRNPQGLLVARDGRVWESEHGPRGGDEINLIRRGGNYGWPIVTYGTEYSGAPWRYNPEPGEHAGYAIPRFAFVPSIGISELIQPDANAFPDWRNHLLASSLHGNALYALKTEGDDITYAEHVPLGERLRDLISLADGRIAIITDSGQLILLRNGAQNQDAASSFVVSGLANRPQLLPEETVPDTPEMAGALVFFYNCGTCHSTSGHTTLIGPPLNGMFGREIGAIEDYPYSTALANASGRWTPSRLRAFLNQEDRQLEGAAMPAVPLLREDFDALVSYLRSMEDMPEEQ